MVETAFVTHVFPRLPPLGIVDVALKYALESDPRQLALLFGHGRTMSGGPSTDQARVREAMKGMCVRLCERYGG